MITANSKELKIFEGFNHAYNYLKTDPDPELLKKIESLYAYFSYPHCRVMVFGSFNQGKSTLLNSLLGQKVLPTDLIPTTGATIKVTYGEIFKTCINFLDGDKIEEKGAGILEQFTRLNEARQMREDIHSVIVSMPHPFLKAGVDLYDLPGTNDQEAQDQLVKRQLLTADLVIQVLDAGKLFTLKEVEDMQYWLLDQGIKNVIFVVNFANLLDEDEREKVMRRATLLAEGFYSPVFQGLSNIFRVDALPAFKARKKGDYQEALTSGLLAFESCFFNITGILCGDLPQHRLPRIQTLAQQIKESLQIKEKNLEKEVTNLVFQRHKKAKKIELINHKIEYYFADFRRFLSLDNLLQLYQDAMVTALKENTVNDWLTKILETAVNQKITSLQQLVLAAEKLTQNQNHCSLNLSLNLPKDLVVNIPEPPTTEEPRTAKSVSIAAGIGWAILGPIGAGVAAAATHYVNENHKREQEELWSQYTRDVAEAYQQAVKDYLHKIHELGINALDAYEKKVQMVFQDYSTSQPQNISVKETQLKDLQTIIILLET